MQIKFISSSIDYSDAVNEYSEIWLTDGEKIVKAWEEVTGLKFDDNFIEATVSNKISTSHPLNLRFNYEPTQKRSILIHELGHRILAGKVEGMREASTIEVHKLLDLVLWKVWKEIYGVEFMEEAIKFEKNLTENYKIAWDWALDLSEEERLNIFNKVLREGISIIK